MKTENILDFWDLETPTIKPSKIVEFFNGTTIFITGGTGFLGALFIEKLLRTCPKIKCIFMLVRAKKTQNETERLQEFLNKPIFNPLKRINPNFSKKIHLISGDLLKPNLGLTEPDRQILITECQILIHCGASVRFVEPIRTATYINIRSTIDIIKMAQKMSNLISFLYVSTAYSNCNQKIVHEKFYDAPLDVDMLLKLVEHFSEKQLEQLTPILLDKYLNTYVFTKAIAENVVRTQAANLPVAILRPAIVTGTQREPITGWIDNLYGPSGIVIGVGFGILRCMHMNQKVPAEMVPADYVINCGLVALYKIGTSQHQNEPPIFNFVSSTHHPINWEKFRNLTQFYGTVMPTNKAIRTVDFIMIDSKVNYLVYSFFTQTLPASIVDFVLICMRKKPFMLEVYKKIDRVFSALRLVFFKKILFTNNNVLALWDEMEPIDKDLFEFDMRDFDWNMYLFNYARGIRVYLMDDPISSIKAAKKRAKLLYFMHYSMYTVLGILFMYFIYSFLF